MVYLYVAFYAGSDCQPSLCPHSLQGRSHCQEGGGIYRGWWDEYEEPYVSTRYVLQWSYTGLAVVVLFRFHFSFPWLNLFEAVITLILSWWLNPTYNLSSATFLCQVTLSMTGSWWCGLARGGRPANGNKGKRGSFSRREFFRTNSSRMNEWRALMTRWIGLALMSFTDSVQP